MEGQCGIGNGGALCVSLSLKSPIQVRHGCRQSVWHLCHTCTACGCQASRRRQAPWDICPVMPQFVQVAKSLVWRNQATYGGGAYLSSGNTLVHDPECELLPEEGPIFLPVHFSDAAFIDNQCGPPQAGASVFWNTPYLLHITCAGASPGHAPYQPGLSNCSMIGAGSMTQRYCHQCVLVNGCADWQGNAGGHGESIEGVLSQGSPTGPQGTPSSSPVVIVPITQQRVSSTWDLRPPSSGLEAATGRPAQRRLSSEPQRPDGMASGGVALRVHEPLVAGYAAGAEMNISVDLLDAYAQVVNTDEFVATRPGAPLPAVTVSQGHGDVFLSGQLTQPFTAGVAQLQQLRLIGNPGQYRLVLESAGAEPAVVEVRHCQQTITST